MSVRIRGVLVMHVVRVGRVGGRVSCRICSHTSLRMRRQFERMLEFLEVVNGRKRLLRLHQRGRVRVVH